MTPSRCALLLAGLCAGLAAGCGGGGGGTCPDGFPRGSGKLTVTEVAAFTPAPEGVAVCPGGDVFLALTESGEIWRLPVDGADPVLHTTLGGRRPGGLACDAEGRLYVADFGGGTELPACVRLDGATPTALVLPTDVGGTTIEHPNGVVVVPGAGVYLSDSGRGEIIRFVEESADVYSATLVASGADLAAAGILPGANGLAYDATSSTLWVAVTAQSLVLGYDLLADGTLAATPRERYDDTAGVSLPDGVAVDEEGTVWVANALGGEILRIAGGGGTVAANVASPASFAFRGGTLFVTSFALGATTSGALSTVDVGACSGSVAAL
jgi:sugar lactone lactonase YvrE